PAGAGEPARAASRAHLGRRRGLVLGGRRQAGALIMAFGSFDNRNSGSALSEINMVPLIDVMLVLLVIFLITAPLLSHSIKIQLPQASSEPVQQDPKSVDLAIDAMGQVFINEQPVALEDLA